MKLKIFWKTSLDLLEQAFDFWASQNPGVEINALQIGRDGVAWVLFVVYTPGEAQQPDTPVPPGDDPVFLN